MKKFTALFLSLTIILSLVCLPATAANNNLEKMLDVCNISPTNANIKLDASINAGGDLFALMGLPSGELASFKYDINMLANEEMTKCSADGSFIMTAPSLTEQPVAFDLWLNQDITSVSTPQFYLILKLSDYLRTEIAQKEEYLYIDYTQIPGFKELLNFSANTDKAELEEFINLLISALRNYVDGNTVAKTEKKIADALNSINVEYENGKYSIVMNDREVVALFETLFDILLDIAENIEISNGASPEDIKSDRAELNRVFDRFEKIQFFDKERAFVLEISDDASYVHTELNLVTNFYDIIYAIDPTRAEGGEALRDMYSMNISYVAECKLSPLPADYKIAHPVLTADNTFDATPRIMPEGGDTLTFEQSTVELKYNDKTVDLENIPLLHSARTFVPLRELANTFGISDENIFYDEATERVTIKSDDVEIVMHIGSSMTFVNNQLKTLDVPAFTYNDRTYIPVRFVSEMLHKKVDYVDLNATGEGNGLIVMIND